MLFVFFERKLNGSSVLLYIYICHSCIWSKISSWTRFISATVFRRKMDLQTFKTFSTFKRRLSFFLEIVFSECGCDIQFIKKIIDNS